MSAKSKKSLFKKGKKKTQQLPKLVKKTAKGAPRTVLAIRHSPHEGLGTLEAFLKEKRIPFQYLDVSEKKCDFPKNPGKYTCIFMLGGPQSVVDIKKYPYLEKEVEFIKKAYEKKVAIMGFCLGAQLLSHTFGGNVYKGPVKEMGWYTIRLTRDGMRDPLMIGFESEPTIFQWHEDGMNLPKDVPSLAGTLIYPNQAFRMNPWTYGFQFHFEVDPKMVQIWLKKNAHDLKKAKGYITPQKIREETALFAEPMKRMAWRFYENLFEYLGHIK